MSSHNTLSASESFEPQDEVLSSGTIDSISELATWLEGKVSAEVIGKVLVSFMARIPAKTPVSLIIRGAALCLMVGESIIRVGESTNYKIPTITAKVQNTVAGLLSDGHKAALHSGKRVQISAPKQQRLASAVA